MSLFLREIWKQGKIMSRQKLKKFADNKESRLIIESDKPFYTACKGKWNSDFFKNENEIVLELACGRGEYTTGLAPRFPNKNFIGIDVKGDRLWNGSTIAEENDYKNVAFLRAQIHHLEDFFEENEVSEIWLTFPDPRPKNRDIKRRLTNPRFMGVYKNILKPNGLFRFKTDNPGLFEYTLEVLEELNIEPEAMTKDLYNSPLWEEHYGIVTRFEKIFYQKGFSINYLRMRF